MGINLILIAIVVLFALCGCCVCLINCSGVKIFAKLPFSLCGCCACLILLVVGIVSVAFNSVIADTIDYSCGTKTGSSSEMTKDIQTLFTKLYTTSRNYYCNSPCPCTVKATSYANWTTNNPSQLSFYSSLNTTVSGNVVNVQWCQNSFSQIMSDLGVEALFGKGDTPQAERDQYAKDYPNNAPLNQKQSLARLQRFMDFMGTLETRFNCAGICEKQPIFYFSNINNGIPVGPCASKLKENYMISKLKDYGIGLIIIGILLIIPWLLHFALYCLPGKASITEMKTLNII